MTKRRISGTTKAIVAELFEQNGGHGEVGLAIDLSPTRTYALTDESMPDQISYHRVRALTSPSAPAAAEDLAALAGGAFVPLEPSREDFHRLAGVLTELGGCFASRALDAIADGRIDAREAGDLLGLAQRQQTTLCNVIAKLRAIAAPQIAPVKAAS